MKGAVSLVELLHEVSGRPRAQLRDALAKAVRSAGNRARCPLHKFELTKTPLGTVWKCISCGWLPTQLERLAYEQGLAHGQTSAGGGAK